MRDLLYMSAVAACLLVALRYPFMALLVWAWHTLMALHMATFGLAHTLPINVVIALVAIGGYIASGEVRRLKLRLVSSLILLFAVWLCVSQIMSLDKAYSQEFFDRFLKVLVFIFLCAQMPNSRLRVNALIWVFVLAIGFFGAKGGVFTIVTLGHAHLTGLPGTVLYDNNQLGIAMAATLPMMLYLREQSANLWVRRALAGGIALTLIAVLGTQSRGAFIALVVCGGFLLLKSQRKALALTIIMALAVPAITFMPQSWVNRMETISNAGEDTSFQGRVDAWVINTKAAIANPVTGVGLRNCYQPIIAGRFAPDRTPRAAHSIYFEVLGGTGFVGLGIYLALLGTAWFKAGRLAARKDEDAPPWTAAFGRYAQISLAAFAVGGASTSMEMWEGYLVVIALIAAVDKMLVKPAPAPIYRWMRHDSTEDTPDEKSLAA